MDYVLPVIFNTAGVRRLITNLFYGNQEGIYLMVDSVDSKSNENRHNICLVSYCNTVYYILSDFS